MRMQSVGEAKYFMSFVDDCSSWANAYMLRHRSEATSKYILFKGRAELHTERHVCVLRTDRVGEYLSNEFTVSLKVDGTQH